MQLYEYALVIGVGLIAGFFNVVAGGGSLITVPVLTFLGLPMPVANATNRVALFFQNIFAVAGFRSKGVTPFPYGIYLSISAFIGAIVGAMISLEIDELMFKRIFALIMVMVIVLTVFSPNKKNGEGQERMGLKHQIIGSVVFFFIGIYGGFIQAGVGFLIMAAITNINHMSLVKTNAIKVFVVLVYTLSALGVFIWKGAINWEYGIALAVGNSLGAWIASRWSVKAGDVWIKRVLVVAVIGLAIKLWFYSS